MMSPEDPQCSPAPETDAEADFARAPLPAGALDAAEALLGNLETAPRPTAPPEGLFEMLEAQVLVAVVDLPVSAEAFPEAALDLLESVVPPRKRNASIVEATEEALRRERLRVVLQSLGDKPAWSDEDHPDLMTVEDVDRYVRRLRETWMPRSRDEIAEEAERNAHISA